MKIAVLSGKGGTGKTFVSVNLATNIKGSTYVDCDVEEPNGRIFLNPKVNKESVVTTKIPSFDEKLCNGCRACVDFCKFNALAFIKSKPILFTDVCHACGGCAMVCKANAITEADRPVGKLEVGTSKSNNINVITGILNLGEASSIPVIKACISEADNISEKDSTTIIDCPPGSSCSVMESISTADFCIIVVEGTSFGFHNFCMVHKLVKILGKPCGIVINKFEEDYPPLVEYCQSNSVNILAKIPYKKSASTLISTGHIISEEDSEYKDLFEALIHKLGGEAN